MSFDFRDSADKHGAGKGLTQGAAHFALPSHESASMPGSVLSSIRNILLSSLSLADFALISPHLEPVEFARGATLLEPGVPIEHVWFLESGVVSIIAVSPEGHRVEAALFGRDGVAPASAMLGIDAVPYQFVVQIAGHGHRMPVAAFRACLDASPAIRTLFGYYLQTLITQIAYTAMSNAIHQVDERCARWLLMVHDRVDGDDISLTHEFLSLMLAVRRPSVTTALHVLEGNRLIRADRGWLTIRDRVGLEQFAGDTYGRSEEEYRRLIGPFK